MLLSVFLRTCKNPPALKVTKLERMGIKITTSRHLIDSKTVIALIPPAAE